MKNRWTRHFLPCFCCVLLLFQCSFAALAAESNIEAISESTASPTELSHPADFPDPPAPEPPAPAEPTEPPATAKPTTPALPIEPEPSVSLPETSALQDGMGEAGNSMPFGPKDYSVACYWRNRAVPDFVCSPVWNPETHSYDAWEFAMEYPLVIKNTSDGEGQIIVEVSFHSNSNADVQMTSDSQAGRAIKLLLDCQESAEVYLSILQAPDLNATQGQVLIGKISCNIVEIIPNEPVRPAEPIDPVEPTVPTEPVEPEEPTVPTESTKLEEPTVPTELVEPEEPVESTGSIELSEPVKELEFPINQNDSSTPSSQEENVPLNKGEVDETADSKA